MRLQSCKSWKIRKSYHANIIATARSMGEHSARKSKIAATATACQQMSRELAALLIYSYILADMSWATGAIEWRAGWLHTKLEDKRWGKGRQEWVSKTRGATMVVTTMRMITTTNI